MAFRAAQTGHLLLSTLHTNSAIAALPRLLDLKIESSLIGSSLIGVLSQVAGTTTVEELLRVLPYGTIVEHRRRFSR